MHLIIIIAAAILLALLLMPFLGTISVVIIGLAVIAGIIYGIVYSVAGVKSMAETAKEENAKAAARKKWVESLPEEEREAELKKDRAYKKKLMLFYVFSFIFIAAIAAICIWRIANW